MHVGPKCTRVMIETFNKYRHDAREVIPISEDPLPIMVASQATTKWSFEGPNLPIDTVTVYRPRGAQIIRKLDLDLEVRQRFRVAFHSTTLKLSSCV